MSETDLAAQLATRLEVVQALEQGAIYALPPWPETCRVVSTYGTLLNLDVRPLLRRIYSQIEAGIVALAPKPMPDVPFMMPPQDGGRETPSWPGQGQGGPRAAEPFPAAPRQAPPQPRQAQADRRPPPQPDGQAPAPQFRPQPQTRPQGAPARGVPQPQQQPHLQPQPQGLRVQPPQRAETLALTHARAPQPAAPQAPPPQAAPQAKPAKKAAPAAPAAKKGRGALLKGGIALLLASAVAFGLWVWLAQPSLFGLLGSGATSSGDTAPVTNDPADPRSRKGDRLPSPASQ